MYKIGLKMRFMKFCFFMSSWFARGFSWSSKNKGVRLGERHRDLIHACNTVMIRKDWGKFIHHRFIIHHLLQAFLYFGIIDVAYGSTFWETIREYEKIRKKKKQKL